MGRCPHNKKGSRKATLHKTEKRTRFLSKGIDLIHAELRAVENGAEEKPLPIDEELPGLGQFYCVHCDRYFGSAVIREVHYRSKPHKKRAKVMKGPAPHTQADADWAGGMGPPDNGPRLRPSEVTVSMAV